MHGLNTLHRLNLDAEKHALDKHGLSSPRVDQARADERKQRTQSQLDTINRILQRGGYKA